VKRWDPKLPYYTNKSQVVGGKLLTDEENTFMLRLDFDEVVFGGIFMEGVEVRDVSVLFTWDRESMAPGASVDVGSFNRKRYGHARWSGWTRFGVAWDEAEPKGSSHSHVGARGFLRAFWCMLQGLPPGKGFNPEKE